MASQKRIARAPAASATIGLCLAAVASTHTSVAFHLQAGSRVTGIRSPPADGSFHRDHASRRSGSATCQPSVLRRSLSSSAEDQQAEGSFDAFDYDGKEPARKEGGAAKELSALLLSAMLLGNPQLSNAATTTQAMGGGGGNPASVDPTMAQSRLIADLEKRLSSMPSSSSTDAGELTREEETPQQESDVAPRVQAIMASPIGAIQQPQDNNAAPTGGASTTAPEAPAISSSSSAVTATAPQKRKAGGGGEPIIKMKDYSFSVRLPELNLPPVSPITVPDDPRPLGAVFSRTADKVEAQPALPGADVVKNTLQGAAKGDGVKGLADAIAAMVPRQEGYNRGVAQLEERVARIVKNAENPTFAPGVPLAPEFTSMFAGAKETAFRGIRPYLPKGVEPELALFMLVTLPVLTIALRTADENSRRPKPAPLPAGYRPPRVVRFPNSPAKVDAEAVAEARKAREEQADLEAVARLREELAAKKASPAAAAVVAELEGGVAAAVAAEPEAMTAELARLRRELASASKLAAKVEALERANARLMGQVAELSKQPSLEAIRLRAEKEAMRAAAQREREEKRATAFSDVKVRAGKLNAAREAMVNLFPSRETDMSKVQETELKPVVKKVVPPAPEPEPEPVVEVEEAEPADLEAEDEFFLKPEDVDPRSAARERLVNAFPSRETVGELGEVAAPAPAAGAKKPAAKKKAAPARKKAATKTSKAAAKAAAEEEVEEAPATKLPKKTKTVAKKKKAAAPAAPAASTAPTTLNGSSIKEKAAAAAAVVPPVEEIPAAVTAATPDDYDDLSEDLSRALRGVQGYDLDALDLEMEDLRPEDLEELRNLEREMGDLDLASLEAEFDQEDDESISQALRMAAESALAHTSGGVAGRRIRTASPVGATSSRSSGPADGGDSTGAMPQQGLQSGTGGAGASFSASPMAEDEMEAFRRLEAEGAGGTFGGAAAWGSGDGVPRGANSSGGKGDDGDWSSLSSKAIARKTVPVLKEYLDEEGIDYPSKVKKAELVDMVLGLLAKA